MRATFRSVADVANRLQRSACSRRLCAFVMTAHPLPVTQFPVGQFSCAAMRGPIQLRGNAFRPVPDIRSAAMQRTDHDRYVFLQTFGLVRETNQKRYVALRTLSGVRRPTVILVASAHGQAD